MKLFNSLIKYCLAGMVMFVLSMDLRAQDQDLHIVQLSGLVMNQDSTETVFGVHIYDPNRGRGTTSDYRGWFSKAFLAGDSIVFSAVGYKTKRVVVPDSVGDRWTLVVALQEDVTQLAEVEINPFPTEEIFKEAFMAMNLTQDQQTVAQSYDPAIVQELVRTMPIEGSADLNYRYVLNQQFYNLRNSAGPQANPLLNPFAWAQFINSLKRKKKKK